MFKKLPEPGPIALRAATEAELNVGVAEVGKSNWGPFIKVYLAAVGIFSPAAWCLAFQVFRIVDAAKDLGLTLPKWFPRVGYTPSFVAAAKKAGRFTTTDIAKVAPTDRIRRGDLVFFYIPSEKRIAHVEIVVEVHNDRVVTVGGNTSREDGKVQRDGGGVWRKDREFRELGDPTQSGFARLDF